MIGLGHHTASTGPCFSRLSWQVACQVKASFCRLVGLLRSQSAWPGQTVIIPGNSELDITRCTLESKLNLGWRSRCGGDAGQLVLCTARQAGSS